MSDSSYHEAGHACVGLALGLTLDHVCIRKGGGGVAVFHDARWSFDYATMSLAGGYAAARAGADRDGPSEGDLAIVRDAMPGALADLVPAARRQAEFLVAREWPRIERVAAALRAVFVLTGDQVEQLIGG